VKRVPTRDSLRIAVLMEMLEEMSQARGPEDAVRAYARRIRRVRPMDAFVEVVVGPRAGLKPGEFKVARSLRAADLSAYDLSALARHVEIEPLPVQRGGVVGDIVSRSEPQLIHDLSTGRDPVLGEHAAGMGSCLAVPIFTAGIVQEWWLMFRRGATAYDLSDLEDDLLIGNLFGAMTANLEAVEQIRGLIARLQEQFEEVARVQQSLLPAALPDIPGASFATSYLTSDQAGGDYYDFFPLGDGRVGVFVGDVSGHGPGAATVMARLHAILHCSDLRAGPAAVLSFVNAHLARTTTQGGYVTGLLGVLDAPARRFTYASAGHPAPRVRDAAGTVRALGGPVTAMPIGIIDEPYAVEEAGVDLAPGQTVAIYTDGLSESFSPERTMLGVDGLDRAIGGAGPTPQDVVDAVHAAVFAHTGKRTRDDDQTLVVFRVD
jgi:sigma-B regulation protein RsbU (phosphoserine phosphatase)